MSSPSSPELRNDGLVLRDAASSRVQRISSLQYNPDSPSRSRQVQSAGGANERFQPCRFKGPAIETIKLDADIDATDSLEHPDQNANAVQYGIAPQLAVLENIVNLPTAELQVLHA